MEHLWNNQNLVKVCYFIPSFPYVAVTELKDHHVQYEGVTGNLLVQVPTAFFRVCCIEADARTACWLSHKSHHVTGSVRNR